MTLKERVLFTRYLSILLHAGLTINQSFQLLKHQLDGPQWKKILPHVELAIASGHTLSESLAEFSEDFPPFYTRMIAVGETSGDLAKVFHYLERQLQRDYRLVSKVRRAFVYPMVILVILTMVSTGLLIFVVPRVAQLFTQLKLKLPLPTILLLKGQYVVQHFGIYILAGFVGLFFLFRFIVKRSLAVRIFIDHAILVIPVIRTIVRNLNVARFAQILSTLLEGGVPLVNALSITACTLSNSIYANAVSYAEKSVTSGKTLSESLDKKIFAPLMVDMMGIGERTGNLQEQTAEVARLYAQEVDSSVKNMSTLIEPLLLVVVAAGVGSIAMAIVLPLYQLPNLLHR